MYKVELDINPSDMKTLLGTGKISSFDNRSDGIFRLQLESYIAAESANHALHRFKMTFRKLDYTSLGDAFVTFVEPDDFSDPDWLVQGIFQNAIEGEIDGIIKQYEFL